MFKFYGEIDNAFKLSQLIIKARQQNVINTTNELITVIKSCTPKFEEHKYLAKVFQALRLEVNQELMVLEECLTQCTELLVSGGRLVIISYHSLEDRLVKNIIKTGNTNGVEQKDIIYGTVKKVYKNLTSKPILPTNEEIAINTRARSAKLRVAEKI